MPLKPVFKCDDNFKNLFKDSTCLLTISVGQEVHEAEKFESTIKLVNDSFQSCIILIDDSLQRHTMALDSKENPESFFEISINEGSLWLERNKIYYNELKNLNKIIRWTDWLRHRHYKIQREKILSLVDQDINYKNSFISSINEFITRFIQRLENRFYFDMNRATQLCFDYLVEECSAFCLLTELNCQFEVYPNQRNSAVAATHQNFIIPTHPQLLHPVAIKFKNRAQLKSQKFSLLQKNVHKISAESY